jgi:hypothetical protein
VKRPVILNKNYYLPFYKEVEEYCEKNGLFFYEVSAKSGVNIN